MRCFVVTAREMSTATQWMQVACWAVLKKCWWPFCLDSLAGNPLKLQDLVILLPWILTEVLTTLCVELWQSINFEY